jgi:DNA-binding transcriptional ArsR family regulator
MDDAQQLEMIFQTLGESNRLRIIKLIGEKKCSVSEIVAETELSQPLVSHHLRILRENHVLETERQGPFVYYKLKDTRILSAIGIFLDIIHSLGETKIQRRMFFTPRWWKMCR